MKLIWKLVKQMWSNSWKSSKFDIITLGQWEVIVWGRKKKEWKVWLYNISDKYRWIHFWEIIKKRVSMNLFQVFFSQAITVKDQRRATKCNPVKYIPLNNLKKKTRIEEFTTYSFSIYLTLHRNCFGKYTNCDIFFNDFIFWTFHGGANWCYK